MTHRLRPPSALALVAGVLLAAAACAGGDDDAAGDASVTTPATATTPDTEPSTQTTDTAPNPTSTAPASSGACPTAARSDDGSPVEITIWHSMSATTGVVFDELIADYNASQPRVQVTSVYQGGYADTFSKYVNTLRTGGDLPTLVQLSEISMQQMVDSESIVPVEDCITAADYDLSDYSEVLLDQYRLDGRLVTMPFQLANLVLFYDGTDFSAAGLDPAGAPVTLDELVTTSRALVDAGVVTSGIAIEIDAWAFEQWVATAGETLVDHDNGRSGRAEQARLDSPAVTDLLAVLQAMHDDGLLLVTGRGGQQAGVARFIAVAQGQAAMTLASSASLGEIYQQIDQVPGVEVRVGPFPGQGGRTTIGGGSIYLTTAGGDAERAAGWDLLAWLNEPEQQVRWSVGTGYVPTRRSSVDAPDLVELWTERPGFRVAWDQLDTEGAVPGGGGPVIGDYEGVRDAIEDGLEALFDGVDVATVQADMQAAADEAIADYNRRIAP